MKIIFKIARNELRYLFYSPVAWFVIIVFLVQCALLYTGLLYELANWQDIWLKNNPNFTGFTIDDDNPPLTLRLFIKGGLFGSAINNLYLFIPVLTMGLVSREINSGSVKLLYSSAVTLRQIVLGKYLGIMLFNGLLVVIVGIFIVTGIFNIQHVDYGMLLSAILGFYLLVCTYSAIGLFMSSLSAYQIVSALSTFIIIFILGHIDGLWQRYDVIRDLTYFLSLQNRAWKMLTGLIVTRDVIYFITVAAMFVAFTLLKLKAAREVKPWYIKVSRYVGVIIAALLVGYVSSRPVLTGYLDTTATQSNTIPKEVQTLLEDLGDSTLEVTLYTNLLGGKDFAHGLPAARNADYMTNMWERYLRFKPDMVFRYQYYYDAGVQDSAQFNAVRQTAAEYADAIEYDLSFFTPPEQMRKTINLQPEGYRAIMQLKYKGRTEFLRTYEQPPDKIFWPDLIHVSAAIKRLLAPSKIPKIYFVSGELERSIYEPGDRAYSVNTSSKGSRISLVNTGFDVDALNLEAQDIPVNAAALVLADPQTDLSIVVQRKLRDYIDAGGNMFILGEPGKQQVLNPMLRHLGVQLFDGQLITPTFDETPDKITPYLTETNDELLNEGSFYENKLIAGDTFRVLMPGATGFSYVRDSSFDIKPLLMTSANSTWLRAGDIIIDSTLPPFNPATGDVKQSSFVTAIKMIRQRHNKEQRIVISGDADFASNTRLTKPNVAFLTSVYSWMANNEFPVSVTQIEPKDTLLNIGALGAETLKIIYVWLMPGLLLLAGTILLIRRKRK